MAWPTEFASLRGEKSGYSDRIYLYFQLWVYDYSQNVKDICLVLGFIAKLALHLIYPHLFFSSVYFLFKPVGEEKKKMLNNSSLNINKKYHLLLFFEELKLIFSFWMRDDLAWVSTQWFLSQMMLQSCLLWRKQSVAETEIICQALNKGYSLLTNKSCRKGLLCRSKNTFFKTLLLSGCNRQESPKKHLKPTSGLPRWH